jgi:hypothetical protein
MYDVDAYPKFLRPRRRNRFRDHQRLNCFWSFAVPNCSSFAICNIEAARRMQFPFVSRVRSCETHDMPLPFWQFIVAVHGCVEIRASTCRSVLCSGERPVQDSVLSWLQEIGLQSKANLLWIHSVVNFSFCQVALQIVVGIMWFAEGVTERGVIDYAFDVVDRSAINTFNKFNVRTVHY